MHRLLALPLLAAASVDLTTPTGNAALDRLRQRAAVDPDAFVEELGRCELAAIAPQLPHSGLLKRNRQERNASDSPLPLVFLHGMGDSCFNNGMQSITQESGEYLGVYSVCIPTGDTRGEDTMNGFFMDMNTNVDVFADKIRADPNLASGFNCVGLSQGNNICRGYIQRYNDPPVNTHLSIHGPLAGVAALPHCYLDGKKGSTCQDVSDMLATLAYNEPMQGFLFQADYFRDINFLDSEGYKKYSQIGNWNNEGDSVEESYKTNFGKTNKFAMIKANGDTVVVPREGEWWGEYASDFKTTLTMKETKWYKDDTFGLRSADEAGKILFNSTEGNHLEFSDEELYGWLDLYM